MNDQPNTQTCQQCTHFLSIALISGGMCRAHPPQVFVGPGGVTSSYPPVQARMPACGEYMVDKTHPLDTRPAPAAHPALETH